MRDVRFAGLASLANGENQQQIEKLTGYRLVRDGDDWVVPGNDPALVEGPRDILKTSDKPWELNARNFSEVAERYVSQYLVRYFEEGREEPKEKFPIYGDAGIRTALEEKRLNFFFTPTVGVKTRLVQETFPYFVETFNTNSVAPLSVDADYQQLLLSIAKLLVFVQQGGRELAEKRIGQKNVLEAVFPTPVHLMSYVTALNTMAPSATTFPLERMASALHFMRGRPWFFPRLFVENIYEQMQGRGEPLADDEVTFFMQGQHFQSRATHSYFLASVQGVNRLAKYVNDVRTHLTPSGQFDAIRMIKAHSLVRLLFADWTTANFTQSGYVKLRLAFSFLDKLANFVNFMQGGQRNEDEIFRTLCARKTGVLISKMLERNFGVNYHSLGRLMSRVAVIAYDRVHGHIAERLGERGRSEAQRLGYIRTVRNTTHGAFLRSEQFEQVFLASAGTLPGPFTYLPLLLLWALVSDPQMLVDSI